MTAAALYKRTTAGEESVGKKSRNVKHSLLTAAFEDVVEPMAAATLFSRTTADLWNKIVSIRVVATWGASERLAFGAYCTRLALIAADVMQKMGPKQVGQ
eukprot:scaffold154629_cov19-Tisochrysis_lutea.AAC.3